MLWRGEDATTGRTGRAPAGIPSRRVFGRACAAPGIQGRKDVNFGGRKSSVDSISQFVFHDGHGDSVGNICARGQSYKFKRSIPPILPQSRSSGNLCSFPLETRPCWEDLPKVLPWDKANASAGSRSREPSRG